MKKQNHLIPVLMSLGGGFLIAALFNLGFFSSAQPSLSDKLFLDAPKNPQIKIIGIDDDSLQEIGRWPWDRSVHAELIESLESVQPKVIAVDINFPEPSNDDQVLAKVLSEYNNIVLPIEYELSFLKEMGYQVTNSLGSLQIFKNNAFSGFTNTPIDRDGVLREIPISLEFEGAPTRSFSYEIARLGSEKLPAIPTDKFNNLIIHFAGKPRSFPLFSYKDVLQGKVDVEEFRDAIILIGAIAPDFHDEQVVPTSLGIPMSGVEIHASAVNTILTQNFLINQSKTSVIIAILLLSLLTALAYTYIKPIKGFFLMIGFIFLYIITVIFVFDTGTILNIPFPLFTIFLSYLIILLYWYFVQDKERRKLKKSFTSYASPEIVQEILDTKNIKLGGDKRIMTVLFSDIRGFTSLSEKLQADELVHLLNEYFSAMNTVIFDNKGIVDKFIGDAIMAFWGAPNDKPDHAYWACKAGIAMIQTLKKFNKEHAVKHNLSIGIGIHTGEMIAGNMGSNIRFDYTVIGDNVNLSSRLEGITKIYGAHILISEETLNHLISQSKDSEFIIRKIDRVVVKGKTRGVNIYEIMSDKINIIEYSKGIELFFDNKFREAKKHFENFIDLKPDDGPTKFHLKRIKQIESGGLEWSGEYKLTSK